MGQTVVSASNETRERAKPARVMLHFIRGLLAVLFATFLLGELNLPYYGATVWDLGVALCVRVLQGAMASAEWAAGHFVFAVGALGVAWLIRIHLKVHRTGQYRTGILDCILSVLAVALTVVYFVNEDQVLPLNATVFSRIALYSAISVASFGLVVAFWDFDERLTALSDSEWNGFVPCTAFAMVAVSIATGQHGADLEAPFFSYRVFNAVLHLVATFGAFAMAIWFQCEVDDQNDVMLKKAQAKAVPVQAGTN